MVVALIEQLLVSVLTSIANEIGPSGSGVDRLIASVLLIPISDEYLFFWYQKVLRLEPGLDI